VSRAQTPVQHGQGRRAPTWRGRGCRRRPLPLFSLSRRRARQECRLRKCATRAIRACSPPTVRYRHPVAPGSFHRDESETIATPYSRTSPTLWSAFIRNSSAGAQRGRTATSPARTSWSPCSRAPCSRRRRRWWKSVSRCACWKHRVFFQEATRDRFIETIEGTVDRRIHSFHSTCDPRTGIVVEVAIFESPVSNDGDR
jgi:hypothetical protein